ncbi:uncharacterized protein LOC126943896 isoform X1 [Macaca thibetana thibetana]|uniref:uncharacterized protein LOC126943896 isoform X1 n=1 Tax=Macaca thibetana thibetana TaxID=257877 RepID=UPI0021BCEC34|nr:uncharacterized protein LOC126943896 isoform X1 [Macaca thibetana thibetana]
MPHSWCGRRIGVGGRAQGSRGSPWSPSPGPGQQHGAYGQPTDHPCAGHRLGAPSQRPLSPLVLAGGPQPAVDGAEDKPHPLPSYTDPDGRCPGLLMPDQMKAGTYKLTFDTEGYWRKRGQESFYPYVEVVFTITSNAQKFHVPLLLSPWSYTTYRGS